MTPDHDAAAVEWLDGAWKQLLGVCMPGQQIDLNASLSALLRATYEAGRRDERREAFERMARACEPLATNVLAVGGLEPPDDERAAWLTEERIKALTDDED